MFVTLDKAIVICLFTAFHRALVFRERQQREEAEKQCQRLQEQLKNYQREVQHVQSGNLQVQY
jgi:ABC-type sugar transport system ATPase subunit